MEEKAVAPATATKHASCVVSSQHQQLAAIVDVAGANSNVDVADWRKKCGAMLLLLAGHSATATQKLCADKPRDTT